LCTKKAINFAEVAVNSKQLELFVRVAEVGSLSKAAVSLGRSQPILSRQIRDLESQLETTLFFRTGRGLVLNETGKRLYARAVHVLDLMNLAEREIRDIGPAQFTHATIAIPTTLGRFIAPLVRTIYGHYPNIHLRIREGSSGPILDWVTTRRVDLAVSHDTMPTAPLSTEVIGKEKMYLVGPVNDTPLSETTNVKDLEQFPLILPGPSEGLRILLEMIAAQVGIRLNVAIEADSFTATRQLINAGYGYSIVPYPAVQRDVEERHYQVSRLTNPLVTRQLVVSTSAHRIPASSLTALVRLIKKAITEVTAIEPPSLHIQPR
jgi:LysR family nitrogen assimilation transcriptional regulator